MNFIKKHLTKVLIFLFLGTMFLVMFFSSKGDSGIVDEIAHIPAGYSYLAYGDYRLNPEHPPVIKDLAAVPLLFLNLTFPYEYWLSNANGENVNNQWETGWKFIYHSGNDYNKMFLWSRLPIMILSLLLGLFVFFWARELFGTKAGLLAVFLYSLDPNIIAHSRFVTTDLGMAVFYVLSVYFFGRYLKNPSKKNLAFSGIVFGLAQVAKFSAILLIPTFIILAFIKIYLVGTRFSWGDFKGWMSRVFNKFWAKTFRISLDLILMFLISGAVVLVVYWFHTKNMPVSVQETLIEESLVSSDPGGSLVTNSLKSLAHISRPAAQYLLGLFMVINHASGGHTAFLLGNFSPKGWWYYFLVTFLIKTPIPVLILIVLAAYLLLRKRIEFKFDHWLLIVPVVFYFYMSIRGSLNIGYRHLLPTLPFFFIYVSQVANWAVFDKLKEWWVKVKSKSVLILKPAILVLLGVWYMLGSLLIYPSYMSYFNEFVGPKNAYKYLVDSNLDWGQDLNRLALFVKEREIKEIKVDYFGGGVPEINIKDQNPETNVIEWHSNYGETTGWIAVSATFLQMSKYFGPKEGMPTYSWLEDNYKPEVVIGNSIFVYNVTDLIKTD